jgi:hypothetical protein
MNSFKSKLALGALCVLHCALLAGCGPGGPPLSEVTGKVTVDGKPVPRAEIAFVPEAAGGSPSLGKTDAVGKYRLAFTQDRYGALIGKHQVTITSKKISASEMPDTGEPIDTTFVAIPKKYQGTLTADVKSSANVINFELDSK